MCGKESSVRRFLAAPNTKLTVESFASFSTGAVSVAVAIIVSNMSVIIPAVLRALGVGDPFMREDTVDPNFSTIEMAPTTSTKRIELGLPKTHGTATTNSGRSEGGIGMAVFRQRYSGDLGGRDDQKHRLTMQASDMTLGSSKTKVADGPDSADSLTQVGNLPPVKRDQESKASVEGEREEE